MGDIMWVIGTAVALYGLVMGVFLISENRSPQATLAWMLAFILAPGVGVLIYFQGGGTRRGRGQGDAERSAVGQPTPPVGR
jgi:cardiolipin synthase